MSLLLRGATVLATTGWKAETDVRTDAALVDRIGPSLAVAGAEVIDCRGLRLVPGFVDLHVHGAGGAMCEDGDPRGIERLSAELARCGVTGFLATIGTLPADRLHDAVGAIAMSAGSEPGARILGMHLEGPYLNPLCAGAQTAAWMRPASVEEFDALQEHAGGRIRLVTVAPEIEGALPFVAAVRERAVTVAIGHSSATAEQALLAVEAGVTHVVHLFNAMRAWHHRDPGVIGAALTEDRLSVELICDGHHVAARAVELAFRSKPPGKVILVSDAVGALGCADGGIELFGAACRIADGSVRVRNTGQLAGSCRGLDHGVRTVHRWLPQLPLAQILQAASAAAAAVIGETGAGTLTEGGIADMVVLDAHLDVVATICRGLVVWRR